jgi:hypothetical protein
MDQHPESTLAAIPPAPPPEAMSSTVPDQVSSTTASSAISSDDSSNALPSQAPSEATVSGEDSSNQPFLSRLQPIPPASEPMQYRAIGLVRGKYTASEEQFTRGLLYTEDGVAIDAVLLGRVMSLVKKHLDLEQPHLWVVYPRTREKGSDLHVQIVGVWEPEKLNRAEGTIAIGEADEQEAAVEEEPTAETEEPTAETEETEAAKPETATPEETATEAATAESNSYSSDLDDCYFSVRGEVVHQSVEGQQLLVKIRRSPKQGEESKAFKVALKGVLDGKAVGYFWDLHVQRQQNELVVQQATLIGIVPPQKRSGKPQRGGPRRGGPGGGRPTGDRNKRWSGPREGGPRESGLREGGPRPPRSGDRPTRPTAPREPIAKPIKRRKDSPEQ